MWLWKLISDFHTYFVAPDKRCFSAAADHRSFPNCMCRRLSAAFNSSEAPAGVASTSNSHCFKVLSGGHLLALRSIVHEVCL